MANFWTEKNNTLLKTLEETVEILPGELTLPLNTTQDIIITLISGSLPNGVDISGTELVGTPVEVVVETEYTFVLRATKNNEIQDRTLRLRVVGADQPEWITPAGSLPVGPSEAIFILDNEVIDFQLEVIDSDLAAGDKLIYYIQPNDGVIPPGITLTDDGHLTGVVEPLLALDKIDSRGGFDTTAYDTRPLDFVIPTYSGWGSFHYDTQPYDFNLTNPLPKKLNRYYQFAVTVADQTSEPVKRQFQIYVVGDDFLKDIQEGIISEEAAEDLLGGLDPENLAQQLGGVFTADFTFIRKPIWITPPDLGYIRADNYATIYLDTLRTNLLSGVVTYTLESTNPDGTHSVLPPGTELDSISGEVIGYIPSQPAITREYTFTVRATRIAFGTDTYPSTLRTFTIRTLGEIDSVITWKTPKDLGVINADLTSTLQVTAKTTVPDSRLIYRLVDGGLPEGLRLSYRGEIIGKATLDAYNCSNYNIPGVYKFTVEAADRFRFSASTREFTIKVVNPDGALYSNLYMQPFQSPEKRSAYRNFVSDPTVFIPSAIYRPNDPSFGIQTKIKILAYAGIERTTASKYAAAATKNHKRRRYNLGDVKRAVAKKPGTHEIVYEVVYVEVIDTAEPVAGETNQTFGIKNTRDLTADSSPYDAKDVNDGNEFVNTEPRRLRNRLNSTVIRADNDAVVVNQTGDTLRYLSNTSNMRKEIEKITISTEVDGKTTQELAKVQREYLPLWMRTGQGGSLQELGYVTAIPLAYCKPGTSEDILLNVKNALKNKKFEFNSLDLDIDRYVLDGSLNNKNDQYIIFANYHFNE